MNILDVWCDGASRNNPGRGACGFYISETVNDVATYKKTTNNRMEYLAIKMALDYIIKNYTYNYRINIYSDSNLAVNVLNEKWKPTANLDLLDEIYPLIMELTKRNSDVKFIKVKGHSDCEGNIAIDRLLNDTLDSTSASYDLVDVGYGK